MNTEFQNELESILPKMPGCASCDGECRFGNYGGQQVFKKKCCKKYKRKGQHCKSCPKI